jgi:hypothetical protein
MSAPRYAIEPIRRVPAAFSDAFQKINNAFRILQAIANSRAAGGLRIDKSDSGWVFTGNAGLPPGYAEEQFTICEDGAPVDVYLLVRR